MTSEVGKSKKIEYLTKHADQRLLTTAKNRAKKANIPFNLTVEDIVIPERCPLLDIPMFRGSGSKASPNSPSLDRIDSTKGYIKGNVWVISYRANAAKNNLSLEELETLVCNLRAKVNSISIQNPGSEENYERNEKAKAHDSEGFSPKDKHQGRS